MPPTIHLLLVLAAIMFSSCSDGKGGERGEVRAFMNEIGTRQFSWEDTSRLDAYYGGTRKVNVRVWYSCNGVASGSRRTPYLLFGDELPGKLEGWSDFLLEQG